MIPEAVESKVKVRPATMADVIDLTPKLRAADRREIMSLGSTPDSALLESFLSSTQRYAFTDDSGTILGMFGVGPNADMSLALGQPVGCVWMLGSDGIKGVRHAFLKQCLGWVDILHRDHPILWNWVDARNNLHLKWLEWLGFRIIGTAPRGTSGELFHQFIRVK
jgi:hypothetical protein